MVPQVVLEFGALLADVGEVDEESRAHVSLEGLYVLGLRGFVHLDQKVAVLEQAASANLLRTPRRDELLVEVVQRFLEVAVHGFADHRRVEIFPDGQLAALVEQEERVEHDLERVDRELELPPHRVDELELDVPVPSRVPEGDQGPSVAFVVHFHHLAHVRLFQAASGDPFAADAFRQQVEQRAEHRGLHLVVISPARQLHGEYQVQIVVRLRLGGQNVGGGATVQPYVAHPHSGTAAARVGLELAADHVHQISQSDLQSGEISTPVDAHHLVHHVVQSFNLVEAEHRQPLLGIRAIVAAVVVAAVGVGGVVAASNVLGAAHLAQGLHHSDPTLAFLADLQGATLQRKRDGRRYFDQTYQLLDIVGNRDKTRRIIYFTIESLFHKAEK